MSEKQEAVFISEMPKCNSHVPTAEEKEAAYQKYIRPNRKDKYSKWKAVVPAEDVNAVISAAIYYNGKTYTFEKYNGRAQAPWQFLNKEDNTRFIRFHETTLMDIIYASCVLTKTEVFDKFGGLVRCSKKMVAAERKEHGKCGPDGTLFELREMTDSDLECIALAQKSGQPNLKQGC